MRPRVKICGLCRREDARLAAALGAELLGCVLAAGSPRRASLEQIAAIRDSVAGTPLVLVFRGASAGDVRAAVRRTGVRRVQLHGAPHDVLARLEDDGLLVHRVFAVAPGARALPLLAPAPTPERPALLDAGAGGSGRPFDWSLLGARAPAATFIGGGITPENAGALLARRPYGIDVSSGVEARPGEKDRGRLERLFRVLEEVA